MSRRARRRSIHGPIGRPAPLLAPRAHTPTPGRSRQGEGVIIENQFRIHSSGRIIQFSPICGGATAVTASLALRLHACSTPTMNATLAGAGPGTLGSRGHLAAPCRLIFAERNACKRYGYSGEYNGRKYSHPPPSLATKSCGKTLSIHSLTYITMAIPHFSWQLKAKGCIRLFRMRNRAIRVKFGYNDTSCMLSSLLPEVYVHTAFVCLAN